MPEYSGRRGLHGADFLAGDGEMAVRFRSHDWATSPLGPSQAWPNALRTAVRIMLPTRHPMAVYWGDDLVCLYNDSYRDILGADKHPAIFGMPGAQAWPEIWDAISPELAMVMAGNGATWRESQHLPIVRQGLMEDAYWTYSYGPLDHPAAASGVGGVLVICTETTQRVLAEQRVTNELDRMRRLFDQAPGFMCVLRGPQHVFEIVNAAYGRLVARPDPIGLPVIEAIPEAAAQGFVALLDRVYATGEIYVGTQQRIVLQRSDDGGADERFLNFVYAPLVDAAGCVTGIFCQGIDVTDNRRAAEALAGSEARFRAAIGAVQGILWTNDAAGRMTGEQIGWAALTGQSQAEYTGYGWAMAVHPDDAEATVAAWRAAVAECRIFAHEHRVRRADGEWRHFSIRAVPIIADGGDIVEWVGVHSDITEQRAAETALRTLNADLEARVEAAVAARLRVESTLRQSQKMDALGQLVGGIAHDFNNMLAVVTSSLEMARRRFPGVEADLLRLIGLGHGSAMRAAALTDRMLAFARQQPVSPTLVDVDLLLGDLRQLFGHSVAAGISLEYDLAAAAATRIDRNQLENAIVNLVVNARDAMARKGRLRITTRRVVRTAGDADDPPAGAYVSIAVADDGAGMTPDVEARVFEPFFTTKAAGQGTGLGLSQVYGLARQFDGAIEIVSAPGQGTTATLFLPIATG